MATETPLKIMKNAFYFTLKAVLEIFQNSQGNICARVLLSIKLQADACILLKRDSDTGAFVSIHIHAEIYKFELETLSVKMRK